MASLHGKDVVRCGTQQNSVVGSNSPMMLGAEAAGEIPRTVIKLGRRKSSKLRAQTQKWRLGRSCSMMFLFVLW